MRRKPTPAQRARQLKSIGVDFGFPLNRTLTPQAKGKMKRAFFTYRGFEGRTPFTSFAAFLASDSGPSSLATFALKEPGRFARNLGVKIVSTTPPRPSTTKRQTTHRHETTLPKVRKENPPRRHRHSVQAPARHRPKKRR